MRNTSETALVLGGILAIGLSILFRIQAGEAGAFIGGALGIMAGFVYYAVKKADLPSIDTLERELRGDLPPEHFSSDD